MARLLKGAYFRTSYSRLCTYSTKPNPYVEVLKTLRSWEKDLRTKSKVPQLNEAEKVPSSQCTSVHENEIVNVNIENLHFNEDVNMIKNTKNIKNICDQAISDITFSAENLEIVTQKQQMEDRCKNWLPEKDVRFPNVEFSPVNKDTKLHKLSSPFHSQSHVRTVKHITESKARTANINKIATDSESHTKKKKSKRTVAKSADSSENKPRTHAENLPCNSVASKNLSKLSGNLSPKDDVEMYLKYFKEKNVSANFKLEKPKIKDFLKSKTKITSVTQKEETAFLNPAHLPKPTFKKKDELSNNLISKNNHETLKISTERATAEIVCDKESTKIKRKSKNSKSKSKTSLMKEDLRQKFKQESAIQSLKSLVEAYINANEINKAHKTFEYLLHDEKKKKFVDVDLYNIILSGWAREGRLDKVKHLFFLMSNDKITPNLQSYAAYFEAISRSKCVDVSEIPKIMSEMKSHGYSSKELLQKCVFIGDQREKVIEALGFAERDLNLPLYVPGKAYSYKLLEELNNKLYEKENCHFNFCFQVKDIPKLSSSQLEIESNSTAKIKSVNTVTELTDDVIKCREYIKECEDVWRKRLTKVINGLKSPKKQQGMLGSSFNLSIYPYLTVIDTEVLVNLLLQETRMLGETAEFYSPNIKVLYKDIALKVMGHYFMSLNKKNNVTDKVHFIYQKYLDYLLNPDLCSKYSPREYWEFLKTKYAEGATIDVSIANWPYSLLIFIGSILYDVLRSNICFNPNRVSRKSDSNFMYPAFHIVYENHDVKLNRQIRAHDMFSKLYRDAKLEHLDFDVALIPMLSPPRPWIKHDSGGLLITKVPFIRFPEQARFQTSYYSTVPSHQLNPCFDSLNNLSQCPWIINKPILDLVIKIFQEGGSEDLEIPLNPDNFQLDAKLPADLDDKQKGLYKLRMEYEKKKGELTSLWFDGLYKLSIANHFRDAVFWFPHNLDFRGRVYPTPPHFNHLGSDLSRSILLFAAGKPLGEKGLDWLKIHLINLTGFKKRSPHEERLKYANAMLPEILDSADNPLGKNKWWMKSDEPLQTLACCKEVANAVRHPNPAEYISHFPVHQDGSCNGLQHYAALGRDELGAIEVNLHPSKAPQDVYSGVAALVEKERARDAEMGLEIAQNLNGFVTRKVVKQTVMTFVYGVTPYGARLQVLKQLKDMPEFPEKHQQTAATYLMKKIFFSIKEMFTATKKIQDWFTECAEKITEVSEDTVEWVTPVGLPVIQPYYKETIVRSSKFCLSKGNKENINHYVSHFEPYQLPNIRKQKNAFAPNFIHSLDSTHMMLTSLFCHRENVTFVSVHDCYWTHASTVKIMNKICREQFVSLHNEPILENLSAFFLERYASATEKNSDLTLKHLKAISKMRDVLRAVPDKGVFNLNQVLNSEYFFS